MIKCYYLNDCTSSRSSKCKTCKNNRMRNYIEDHYEKCEDLPKPEKCPKLSYSGPAEQTAGYKCPVCGGFTNPYHLDKENLCSNCGYKLNV